LGPALSAILFQSLIIAMLDGPEPGPADVIAVGNVLVQGTAAVATAVAATIVMQASANGGRSGGGPAGSKRTGPNISGKIERQMVRRGWTNKQITEAVQSGKQTPALNKATGNPATRYEHPETGQSVVVDDVTGDVIHVGGRGFNYGPGSGDLR